ncbi:SLC26A11 [Branchiostoma lanceolatum]|uniref:Sodium-independent sulfate anion transporter n=1 Tax=Branchiostoma lanceolatum TaxID=7740 RepID=A0A8K0AED8_BRALA|nr:SLC26A11 [Branchiostoma lanceolatum]
MTMSVQTETSTFEPSCPTSCNVTTWARRNCTAENLRRKFPITLWLPRYQCSWIQSDFIAGLTVALTVIPQGLAYAHLAELPLQYGLYSSFMGCLVYFLLGSSKDITLGPTAIMSLMVASYAEGDTTYAVALTLLCGCIQLGMGIFRLGFLVNFISFPVINGFTSAAAITIAFGQVKHVLGLHNIPRDFFPCVYYTFKNIGKTNLWDLLMGAVCFVLLLILKWLKDVKWDGPDEVGYSPTRWQQAGRKIVWLIGTARNAVVVVCAALVVVALKSQDIDVLTLTQQVQPGLPAFQPPAFTVHHGNTTETAADIFQGLGAGLAVVPLIGFLECIAIGKAFARQNNYRVDANQELLAIGMGNIVSSFVSSYPITGSFSRTAVNSHSGVKTPAGGLVTAAVVLLSLSVLTPSFHYIPQAALAAVIISAVLTMVDIRVLVKLWRLQKMDLLPLVCTFFGTFIGIEWGILAGVGVSAMILLFPQARPGILVDNKDVLILQPDRGLHYPGVDFIRTLLYDRALKEKPYRPVVLDCSHMASIDYTTIQGIKEVLEEFNRMRVPLIFAALKPHLQEVLTAADLPGFRCYATANEAASCIYEDGDPETNPFTPLLNAVQH